MNNVLLTFVITFSMFTFVCGLSVVWTRECRKCKKWCRKADSKDKKRKIQYIVEYTKDGKFKSGFTFDALENKEDEKSEKKFYTISSKKEIQLKKEIEKEREKLKEIEKEKEWEKGEEKYRKIIFYIVVIYYVYKIYKVI